MRRVLALVGMLLTVTVSVALAQAGPAAQPGVLARLEGRWEGTGIILGQPSRVQMEWAPVLAGRFSRISFTSLIGADPGARRFEGHAYYQQAEDGQYRATWFDSSGLVRPITAVGHADALVATWGTAETEVGETTYRLTSEAQMEVVDRVRQRDGTWREFGRSTLARVPSHPR